MNEDLRQWIDENCKDLGEQVRLAVYSTCSDVNHEDKDMAIHMIMLSIKQQWERK